MAGITERSGTCLASCPRAFMATPGWINRAHGGICRLAENAVPTTVAEASPDAYYLDVAGVSSLGGDDLPKLFSKAVLTNPAAWEALGKKFPSLKFVAQVEIRDLAGERAAATGVRANGYEQFPNGLKAENVKKFFYAKSAAVRAFSTMTADPKAAGEVLVPTEFGGAVVLAQDTDFGWPHPFWPDGRRHAILDALDAAVPGKLPARLLTDGYSVALFCRKRADGSPAGVMLFNLGAGETPPLRLALRRVRGGFRLRRPLAEANEPLKAVATSAGETVVEIPPLSALSPVLVH